MKLVIAIVHERDKMEICDALTEDGFQYTVVASTGGFLRDGKSTLLIGIDDSKVDDVIDTIKKTSSTREQIVTQPPMDLMSGMGMMSPIKVQVGGAVIFVLNVERFEHA
ncbi:MAG: cyclic-di-AMP receptor [Armatimonadetes bacterium]|nr:cyclic-di-AMP receptor [Candidatus Hippobium faecium]